MVICKNLDINAPLTEEEKEMLKQAEKMPITFDEDCPELTVEQLKKMHRVTSPIYKTAK